MNVVVPAIAATAVALLNMPRAANVALIAVAVSPVPPILPGKQMKFGGRASYVFGLMVAVSLTSIVLAPLAIRVMGAIFQIDTHFGVGDIAKLVLQTVLAPLAVGLLVRQLAPNLAERIGPPVARIANVLLLIGILPVLYTAWPGISSLIGHGTVLVIVVVVLVAIAAGHLIGGPSESDRTALGITSAMRHPGIAMAIATTNFPDDKLMPAAIALYVLVAAMLTTVYGKLRSHRHPESLVSVAHTP
jgi:BASS family bile acid:Na+ symporter